MKQIKLLGILAIALSLGLAACNGGGNGGEGGEGGDQSQAGGVTECTKHTWGEKEVIKPATCTEDGQSQRTCTVCGAKEEPKTIKASHTWGDWTKLSDSTCTVAGKDERECSVCHEKEQRDRALADHTFVADATATDVAPTCTAGGTENLVCSVCGEKKVNNLPANGHTWGEWEITKEAECEVDGSRKHVCSVCGVEESEVIEKLEHQLELVGGETPAPAGEATVRLYKCARCNETYLGFSADEPSAASLPHLMEGANGGMRFFGRPIGNAMALTSDGTSVNQQNNEVVYCSTETGDFFEYVFTLNAAQAATLATARLYCDARPADYLSGDFWAYNRSADDWTPGFYIDGADDHVQHNEDGTVMMVKDHAQAVKQDDGSYAAGVELDTEVKMGARIEDYRYILYVDGNPVDFDPDTSVPAKGSNTNMTRAEYVLPYTFHLHEGKNTISLRMAGGYRSEFYNFVFRPYVAPTPITVSEANLEIREGKTAQITSSMTDLKYASANTGVATVDANGLVTGVKAGETTITVSKDGNFKDAKVAVKVLEKEGIVTLNLTDAVIAPTDGVAEYNSSYSGQWYRNFKKDATLTYTFQSELAGLFDIQLGLRGAFANVGEVIGIKVNDADVVVSGAVNSNSSAVDTIVGQANLKVGENVMVITALADSELYLKSLKFIPHVFVAFQTYSIEDLEANRTDSGWESTKDFGGEKAFKFNKAGSVTVTYNAEAAGKALLQLKIGVKFSNKGLTGFWKQDGTEKTRITINGTAIAAGAEPDFSNVTDSGVSDSGNISIPEWFNIIEIDLVAGENTIKVEFLTGGYSYYLGGIALAK